MNHEEKGRFRESLHQIISIVRDRYPNLILDRLVHSLDWEDLNENLIECDFSEHNISSQWLQDWVTEYSPNILRRYGDYRYKKLVEFGFSYSILYPQEEDVIMDSAGGDMGYLTRLNCKRKILQDIRISDETREIIGPDVEYIEGDAGSIPLADESIDLISCHHSFEHFQGDSDIGFINEVQRLLTVGGKCCILPIFIANRYAEITERRSLKYKFDPDSTRIIDPTTMFPGGWGSGFYARTYDIEAFRKRILSNIDLTCFRVRIISLTMDGDLVPDRSLPSHRVTVTRADFPHRALVIERIS